MEIPTETLNPFLIQQYVLNMQTDHIDDICENFEKLYNAISPLVDGEVGTPKEILRDMLVTANSLSCWPDSLD